jgi:hypothetical protein
MFMNRGGCGYNGGSCHPIVDKCEGCGRVDEYPSGRYCRSYAEPPLKWARGECNFATHIVKETKSETKRMNALKASKKRAAGRL